LTFRSRDADRGLGICVIDARADGKPSWRQAGLRYVYAAAGCLPIVAVALYVFLLHPAAMGHSELFWALGVAVACAAVWALVNVVLIVQKRDPIYDRWAGTAVVLD
jgi:hypothetical protein